MTSHPTLSLPLLIYQVSSPSQAQVGLMVASAMVAMAKTGLELRVAAQELVEETSGRRERRERLERLLGA